MHASTHTHIHTPPRPISPKVLNHTVRSEAARSDHLYRFLKCSNDGCNKKISKSLWYLHEMEVKLTNSLQQLSGNIKVRRHGSLSRQTGLLGGLKGTNRGTMVVRLKGWLSSAAEKDHSRSTEILYIILLPGENLNSFHGKRKKKKKDFTRDDVIWCKLWRNPVWTRWKIVYRVVSLLLVIGSALTN